MQYNNKDLHVSQLDVCARVDCIDLCLGIGTFKIFKVQYNIDISFTIPNQLYIKRYCLPLRD